ncbi:hypothetical protein NXV84_02015 [Bacteroides fragilis]|nr:hypothetical protein [Bacteroides fragilis]
MKEIEKKRGYFLGKGISAGPQAWGQGIFKSKVGSESKRSTITKDRRTARQSQGQEDKELKIG